MQQEDRIKIIALPYNMVMNVLLRGMIKPGPDTIKALGPELPDDTKILHVENDIRKRVFVFFISSQSFEQIKPGEMPGQIYPLFIMETAEPPQLFHICITPIGEFPFGEVYTCSCGTTYVFTDMDEGKGYWRKNIGDSTDAANLPQDLQ